MITYKHEKYIKDAIEGVLNQECECEFELIIADDNSPDKTIEIVESFKGHLNFHKIRYFRHSENIGMMKNFIWTLKQARGNYIAFCEGDDYWTNSKKLQKQLLFLINNPAYKLVGHRISELNQGTMEKSSTHGSERDIHLDEFLMNGGCSGIYTCSILFKKDDEIFDILTQKWTEELDGGDYLVLLLYARKYKKVKLMNDIMGVYRIHEGGIWSSRQRGIIEVETAYNSNNLYKSFLQFTTKEKNKLNYSMLKRIYVCAYGKYKHNYVKSKLISLAYKTIGRILIPSNFSTFIVEKLYKRLQISKTTA